MPDQPQLMPVPGAQPRYDEDGREIVDIVTCGTCGRSWNDAAVSSVTPAPAGRCPFEHEHEPEPEDAGLIDRQTLQTHLRMALEPVNDGDLVRDLRHIVTVLPPDEIKGELLTALRWRLQPVR